MQRKVASCIWIDGFFFNTNNNFFFCQIELEKYKRSFTQLVTQKYITAVLPEHSRSVMDRLLDATEKEKEKYTIMTAKDIANAKISAEAHIDALYGSNEIIGMKRKAFDPIDEQRKVKQTIW